MEHYSTTSNQTAMVPKELGTARHMILEDSLHVLFVPSDAFTNAYYVVTYKQTVA